MEINDQTACSLCKHRNKTCTFVKAPLARRKSTAQSAATPRTRRPSLLPRTREQDQITVASSYPSPATSLQQDSDTSPSIAATDYFDTSPVLATLSPSLCTTPGHEFAAQTPLGACSACLDVEHASLLQSLKDPPHVIARSPAQSPSGYPSCDLSLVRLEELINLYYEHVHPCLPILETRETFELKLFSGQIPEYLSTLVLAHGARFCETLAPYEAQTLSQTRWILPTLTEAMDEPTLAAIHATLLLINLPDGNKSTTSRSHWALIVIAVAMSRDLGLHREDPSVTIHDADQRRGRIAWWSVYIHDKWLSHLHNQPSHISPTSPQPSLPALSDFADSQDRLPLSSIPPATAFVSLAHLCTLLSDVLAAREGSHMDTLTAVSHARHSIERLAAWRARHWPDDDGRNAYAAQVQLSSFAVCVQIHGSLHSAWTESGGADETSADALAEHVVGSVTNDLCPLLGRLAAGKGRMGLGCGFVPGMLVRMGLALKGVFCNDDSSLHHDFERSVMLKRRRRLFEEYCRHLTDMGLRGDLEKVGVCVTPQ